MALIEILMPQMGESVMEATIISWLKKEGEKVEAEEPFLEVATDKVDTEVPAVQEGIIKEFLANEGDIVKIGSPIAILSTDGAEMDIAQKPRENGASVEKKEVQVGKKQSERIIIEKDSAIKEKEVLGDIKLATATATDRFYSPLVKNIAKEEHISKEELDALEGTGKEGRVTKNDIINHLKKRKSRGVQFKSNISSLSPIRSAVEKGTSVPAPIANEEDEVIEMGRVRRIIADRMVESRNVSAHVHSFVEADVTNIVNWRNKVRDYFLNELGVKLTFTPIFIEALAKALQDYPMMNISVDGYKIIKRKRINIGIAVALPEGNLIVPVIKNADQLNLVGLARQVNDFAARARANQLSIEEISGSTYTLTNVGSFGSTMGTPIILQPNVAILAIGAIEKKPTVIETEEYGDVIAIRQIMTLSHSYDHRVIDGALGSMFVKRVGDYLEKFDDSRTF
ncbi:MAG: 2-oxo acid dehydrogenase subunit E2 [Cyclobacteriaceae bacterium]|nr:2-oxo acid dehydrogenase subunit E2 [Cyclobacteriaceae bacterium]